MYQYHSSTRTAGSPAEHRHYYHCDDDGYTSHRRAKHYDTDGERRTRRSRHTYRESNPVRNDYDYADGWYGDDRHYQHYGAGTQGYYDPGYDQHWSYPHSYDYGPVYDDPANMNPARDYPVHSTTYGGGVPNHMKEGYNMVREDTWDGHHPVEEYRSWDTYYDTHRDDENKHKHRHRSSSRRAETETSAEKKPRRKSSLSQFLSSGIPFAIFVGGRKRSRRRHRHDDDSHDHEPVDSDDSPKYTKETDTSRPPNSDWHMNPEYPTDTESMHANCGCSRSPTRTFNPSGFASRAMRKKAQKKEAERERGGADAPDAEPEPVLRKKSSFARRKIPGRKYKVKHVHFK